MVDLFWIHWGWPWSHFGQWRRGRMCWTWGRFLCVCGSACGDSCFFGLFCCFFYPWASDSWGWSESQGAGRFWLISVISPTYSVACWDMPMVPMWCMPGCSKLFRTQRSQQFFNRLLFGLCFHSPVDQKLGHVFRKKQRRFFMPSGRT